MSNPALTSIDKDSIQSFADNLLDYTSKDTKLNLSDLQTEYANLLAVPSIAANSVGLDKMMNMIEYTDDLISYSETGSINDYMVAMDKMFSLEDDANYPGSPFSASEKEKLNFMMEAANFKIELKDYRSDDQTVEEYEKMEKTKLFLQNRMPDTNDVKLWKEESSDNNFGAVQLINSNIQTSILGVGAKAEYQIYEDLALQYFEDATPANKALIDAQKIVLDGLGMGATQDSITQNIYNYINQLDGLDTWQSPAITNLEVENKIEEMFNLTKNPISNELAEWESVRDSVTLLHARLGAQDLHFSQTNTRIEEQSLHLQVFYQKNISVDMADMAIELQNKTNAINALYAVIAKLQDLSLAKYI